jgi:hypothetical protein
MTCVICDALEANKTKTNKKASAVVNLQYCSTWKGLALVEVDFGPLGRRARAQVWIWWIIVAPSCDCRYLRCKKQNQSPRPNRNSTEECIGQLLTVETADCMTIIDVVILVKSVNDIFAPAPDANKSPIF